MKMEAEIEIEFKTRELAQKALKILKGKEVSDKVKISYSVEGKVLEVEVEAKSFAVLRARVTSLLRDLKVVLDSIALVEKN